MIRRIADSGLKRYHSLLRHFYCKRSLYKRDDVYLFTMCGKKRSKYCNFITFALQNFRSFMPQKGCPGPGCPTESRTHVCNNNNIKNSTQLFSDKKKLSLIFSKCTMDLRFEYKRLREFCIDTRTIEIQYYRIININLYGSSCIRV
jgi:hypothetical protein